MCTSTPPEVDMVVATRRHLTFITPPPPTQPTLHHYHHPHHPHSRLHALLTRGRHCHPSFRCHSRKTINSTASRTIITTMTLIHQSHHPHPHLPLRPRSIRSHVAME